MEERLLLDRVDGGAGGVPPGDEQRAAGARAHHADAACPFAELAAVGARHADELARGVRPGELDAGGGQAVEARLHEENLAHRLDDGKGRAENRRVMPAHRDEDRPLAVPFAPRGLAGRIDIPASKSITQRALVAAALAGAGARVVRPLDAEDPRLLARALGSAGFRLTWGAGKVASDGFEPCAGAEISLGNNGTGVRFMLAQLAATPGAWRLDGVPRLRERPMAALASALRSLGAVIEPLAGDALRLPLRIDGRALAGGDVTVDAAASSQFVSALLLLAPRLPRGLAIRLTGAPPSRPYLALTVEVLRAFGADAGWDEGALVARVAAGPLRPATFTVEGDWSAAAFPLAGVAVAGGAVELDGVSPASRQGDAIALALLAGAGCAVTETPTGVRVSGPVGTDNMPFWSS